MLDVHPAAGQPDKHNDPYAGSTPTADVPVVGHHELDDAIAQCLCDPSPYVRSSAIRALADRRDSTHIEALICRLSDHEPIVRISAMQALRDSHLPVNPLLILQSLVGDPEPIVKQAAIETIVRSRDLLSVSLLIRLVCDQSEEDIYWADNAECRGDRQLVQATAIWALGELGDPACISPLIEFSIGQACHSHLGQIFAALAKLGKPGIRALQEVLDSHADDDVQWHVVNTLLAAQPEALDQFAATLANQANADMRLIAIERLPQQFECLRQRVYSDSHHRVRATALLRLCEQASGHTGEELARQRLEISRVIHRALHDVSAHVVAAALSAYARFFKSALDVSNTAQVVRTMLRDPLAFPNPPLNSALHQSANTAWVDALCNGGMGVEGRILAARYLVHHRASASLQALVGGMASRDHRLRIACLEALFEWCSQDLRCESNIKSDSDSDSDSDFGLDLVAQRTRAIVHSVLSGDIPPYYLDLSAKRIDYCASIPSGVCGSSPIKGRSNEGAHNETQLQVSVFEVRRLRQNLQTIALKLSHRLNAPWVTVAIINGVGHRDASVQEAALRALLQRLDTISLEHSVIDELVPTLQSETATIRHLGAEILINLGHAHCVSEQLHGDEDPHCRVQYVRAVKHDKALLLACLADSSEAVRQISIRSLLTQMDVHAAERVLEVCVRNRTVDTLRQMIRTSELIRAQVILQLKRSELSSQDKQIVLEACANP